MKKDMQIFKENGWSIRIIEIDGNPWFVGKDIAESLGYANTREAIRSHCKKANDYTPRQNGAPVNPTPMKIIPEREVISLISKSKTDAANAAAWILSILPTKNYVPIIIRDEMVALKTIEQALGVELIRQYNVGPFRIDGYDKNNNVAYEVDEQSHNGKEKKDKAREDFIKGSIGCKFVRIKL